MATRTTKKNAEAAPQAAAPQMPDGLNLQGLGGGAPNLDDFPADDAKLAPEQAKAQAAAQAETEAFARREYTPSPAVMERLNALPKDDIKKEIGLDIDFMIRNTKKYGTLEALAFGTFTPPLTVYIGMPHEKRRRELATVRIWNMPAQQGQEAKWGYEMHHVGLKYKLDENGHQIMKNGRPEMAYDRNPIKPGDILTYNGVEMKPEQVDRLRLTGNLGEPLVGLDYNNNPINTVISVDPYNNHELIGVKSTAIKARLEKMPEYKFRDREGVDHVYKLSDKAIGELSLGRGVWLKPETAGDKDIFVQYSASADRLQTATSFEQAKRKEREVKHNETQAQNLEKQQTQEMSAGMHL